MAKRCPVLSSRQWPKGKASRELHDHYHALGVLQARWAVVELQLQQLCWFLIGAGPRVGRAITNDMGNVARTNLMVTLAREEIKHPDVIAFFEAVEKLFNAHRDNRNFITHCRIMYPGNVPAGSGLALFQQFKADRKFRHSIYIMPIEVLRRVADEIEAMGLFISRFFALLESLRPGEDPASLIGKLPSLDMPPPPPSLARALRSYMPGHGDPPPPSPT